jgi:hypothetical protein
LKKFVSLRGHWQLVDGGHRELVTKITSLVVAVYIRKSLHRNKM